jgi:hypothetical protein
MSILHIAAVALGKAGGSVTGDESPKKAKASRLNGLAKVKPGSRPRGWPKGVPRKGHPGKSTITTDMPLEEAAKKLGKKGGEQVTEAKTKASQANVRKAIKARRSKKSQAT